MSENESMTDAQRAAWLHEHCQPGCTLAYERTNFDGTAIKLSVAKSVDYAQTPAANSDQGDKS